MFGGDFVVCMCVVHCTKSGPETGHKSCIILICLPVHLIYILNIHSCRLKHICSYMTNKQTNKTQVDLPIFTIHGNHDDPTRDGGPDLLSAVDLLSVSNLVNYFGRQDDVESIKISPVLLQKGETNVALYGMGSMRDERLNRMWQGKKVKFLRPELGGGGDDEDEENRWFNIFTLHQNRDLGRGSKNCVHESMIPE